MAPTLEQFVEWRMLDIAAMGRSGVGEMTGKARREYYVSPHEVGKIVGRYGGLNIPELERAGVSPSVAARAIERGHGKVFNRILREVVSEGEREGLKRSRKRSRGKLVIPPHAQLTKRCKLCGVDHSKGEHRFHGKGAFHSTHLFAFGGNPAMKRRRNPQEIPDVFKRFLEHIGYLPATFSPEMLRATYNFYTKDGPKVDRQAYEKFKRGRSLFSEGPLFNRRRPKVSRRRMKRKNPGVGRAFTFHGSFRSLILARRRERATPGSFILEKNGRYYVLKMKRAGSRNPRRRPRARKNPPGLTKIYGRVLRVEAQKTQKHRCDAECAAANHCYYHNFKVGPALYGEGTGKGKRLIIE